MMSLTLQVFYQQKFMKVLQQPDSTYFLLSSNLPDVSYIFDTRVKSYLTLVTLL